MNIENDLFPYTTNLYCEENSKYHGQGNRLAYTKKFLYHKDTKEVFNIG